MRIDLITDIKALSDKAAKAGDSGDAMRFSQAANNIANAMSNVCTMPTEDPPNPTWVVPPGSVPKP
jgi:hypothetical protein